MRFAKNLFASLIVALTLSVPMHSYAQGDTLEIFEMEYFFNTDPGFGNATPIAVPVPDSTISALELISTAGLSTGFHVLGLRARNVATNPKFNVLDTGTFIIEPAQLINPILRSAGQWGITETRLLYVDQSDAGSIVEVDQMEYFFDNDPGVGSAISINTFTQGNQISIIETLDSDTLSVGFHLLGFRARAVGGAWGTTETRLIYVDPSNAGGPVNVDQIEYFFDEDPGVGSATQVAPFAASNIVSLMDSISTNTLSVGFHILGMRARAVGGVWGTTESRLIFVDQGQGVTTVDQLEYFFDADPGVGLANPITAFTPAGNVSVAESLSSSGLSPGFHVLGMRARGAGGSWGTTETKLIFVDEAGGVSDITEFEYFIGNDPGFGLATNVAIDLPGVSVSQDALLATDTLSVGSFQLYVRARDANGSWGITEARTFGVTTIAAPIISSIQPLTTKVDSIEIAIAFEKAVSGLSESAFVISEGGVFRSGSLLTLNDSSYTAVVDFQAEGDIAIDLLDSAAFAIVDGNPTPRAATFTVVYDVTPPALTVTPITTDQVSPELSGLINDSTAALSITISGNSYPPTSVSEGTWVLAAGEMAPLGDGIYDVSVSAVDLAGNVGTDSTLNELTISGSAFQAQPATNITSTSFDANWSLGPDAVSYELDVSEVNDFSSLLPGYDPLVVAGNSAPVAGLDFSSNYYYRVRFRDSGSVLSANSNGISVKTSIDSLTLADSSALIQIYNSIDGPNWSPAVNWETARLRDWDGVVLDPGSRTRVSEVSIAGRGASGVMEVIFQGSVAGGLSELSKMDVSNNDISSLMDFSGTSITDLNVSGNSLEFDDLEPLSGIATFQYSPQSSIEFQGLSSISRVEISHLSDTALTISTPGTANAYTFLRNGTPVQANAGLIVDSSRLEIQRIDFENMGTFSAQVSNSILPALTLDVDPVDVLATANVEISTTDTQGGLVNELVNAYLLEAIPGTSFDTLGALPNVSQTFSFTSVVLADYLAVVEPIDQEAFIPTYYGDDFEWSLAETLLVRSDTSIQIKVVEAPPELTSVDGDGILQVLIEEDFTGTSGRIDARRRAARRKCGLRRRTGGGRPGQAGDFVLIAYGETDENGEFQFGFLPQGVYRFFVEYPGIPLDQAAQVEFEIGELGISDTEFKLQAFVTDDGVSVTIDRVLGNLVEYFKALQVYPNPTSEVIKIHYRFLRKSVKAQLTDLNGRVFWQEELFSGFDQQRILDISGLDEGIYLLHLYDEDDSNSIISYRVLIKD